MGSGDKLWLKIHKMIGLDKIHYFFFFIHGPLGSMKESSSAAKMELLAYVQINKIVLHL
jgi:hypothetical protein